MIDQPPLFRATNCPFPGSGSRFVSGAPEEVVVPGSHITTNDEPHVRVAAAAVQAALARS